MAIIGSMPWGMSMGKPHSLTPPNIMGMCFRLQATCQSPNAILHSRIAGNAIIAKAKERTLSNTALTLGDQTAIPQVVFTSPIVASVGLTRQSAATKGIKVRQITAPVKTVGGILHADTIADGWAQWLVDGEDRLVGATIVGTDAADLLHASTVAIVGEMKLVQLMHAVPCFPTMSEVYLNMLEAAGY